MVFDARCFDAAALGPVFRGTTLVASRSRLASTGRVTPRVAGCRAPRTRSQRASSRAGTRGHYCVKKNPATLPAASWTKMGKSQSKPLGGRSPAPLQIGRTRGIRRGHRRGTQCLGLYSPLRQTLDTAPSRRDSRASRVRPRRPAPIRERVRGKQNTRASARVTYCTHIIVHRPSTRVRRERRSITSHRYSIISSRLA